MYCFHNPHNKKINNIKIIILYLKKINDYVFKNMIVLFITFIIGFYWFDFLQKMIIQQNYEKFEILFISPFILYLHNELYKKYRKLICN